MFLLKIKGFLLVLFGKNENKYILLFNSCLMTENSEIHNGTHPPLMKLGGGDKDAQEL